MQNSFFVNVGMYAELRVMKRQSIVIKQLLHSEYYISFYSTVAWEQ